MTFILLFDWGYGFWGKRPIGKLPFSSNIKGKYYQPHVTVDADFDHLAQVVFCQVSPLPPGLHCPFWESLMCSPYLGRESIYILINSLEFHTGGLSLPFLYFITYFYHYGLTDAYFILWDIFQCYMFKLFQIWPLGALSVCSCVPLTYPHHPFSFSLSFPFLPACLPTLLSFSISLLSGTIRCSGLILCFLHLS